MAPDPRDADPPGGLELRRWLADGAPLLRWHAVAVEAGVDLQMDRDGPADRGDAFEVGGIADAELEALGDRGAGLLVGHRHPAEHPRAVPRYALRPHGAVDIDATEPRGTGVERRAHDRLHALRICVVLDDDEDLCGRHATAHRPDVRAELLEVDPQLGAHAISSRRAWRPAIAASSSCVQPLASDHSRSRSGRPAPKNTASSRGSMTSAPVSTTQTSIATRPMTGHSSSRITTAAAGPSPVRPIARAMPCA